MAIRLGEYCSMPLQSSDFSRYEITPDGILYLDEIQSEEELACLAMRYLNTSDVDDRRVFGFNDERISNGLMEALKAKLRQFREKGLVPGELENRYKVIMENELSEDLWNTAGAINLGNDSFADQINNATVNNSDSYAVGSFRFIGLSILGDKKLKFSFSPAVQAKKISQQITESDEKSLSEYYYLRMPFDGDASFFARDDSWKLSLWGKKTWSEGDVAPDYETSLSQVFAGASVRRFVGTPLMARGSFFFGDSRYQKPVLPGQNTKFNHNVNGSGRLTYQFDELKLGFVLDGSMGTTSYAESLSNGNRDDKSTSLLAQWRLTNSALVSAGAGGGFWTNNFSRRDTGEVAVTSGSSVHGRGGFELRLGRTFELLVNGQFFYNRGEGTFAGWYPSWNTSASMFANLGPKDKWRLGLELYHNGNTIKLNNSQNSRTFEAIPRLTWRASDDFKLSANGDVKLGAVDGFGAYDQFNLSGSLSVAYRVSKKGEWWLIGSIYGYTGTWKSPTYQDTWTGLGGFLNATCFY